MYLSLASALYLNNSKPNKLKAHLICTHMYIYITLMPYAYI